MVTGCPPPTPSIVASLTVISRRHVVRCSLTHLLSSPRTRGTSSAVNMTRKAKYKNGASVVLGDLEGTMPVGVEDEEEEEEEVDVEVSDHDRELTTLSRQPAYPNITRVGRITGSFVSAPSALLLSQRQLSTHFTPPRPLCPTRQQRERHRAVLTSP